MKKRKLILRRETIREIDPAGAVGAGRNDSRTAGSLFCPTSEDSCFSQNCNTVQCGPIATNSCDGCSLITF